MRRTTLLIVLGLCAGTAWAGEQAREGPVPQPLAWVASQSIPKTRSFWASYSATKAQDLVFTAVLSPALRGEHRLGLRLYTPRGHLYQTLTVPFSVPTPPRHRHAPPLPPTVVTARLPIAGTPIVASSLYGRWRVVPHLDEADEPCGYAHRFDITR